MLPPTKDSSSLVTFISTLTSNAFIDPLLLGSKWGGMVGTNATIYYSFPESSSTAYWSASNSNYGIYSGREPFYGFVPLSPTQQDAATNALQAWANVANITLIKVAETPSQPGDPGQVGDIRVASTYGGSMDQYTYAYAYQPYPAAIGGDVWLNPIPPAGGNNFSLGGAGFETLIHELGHALGLDHPFKADSADTTYLSSQYDNYKYTVMSYSDAPNHFDYGDLSFYPTTPMLLDIQAIQYLYGANMTYHTSDDTYVFDGNSNYYQTIWDAGGTDTIQYNSSKGGIIDLNAGNFSTLGNTIYLSNYSGTQTQNVAIAYNVTIENAIGGNGNDQLVGNDVDNALSGEAGNDSLTGGSGNDSLDGGLGVDTLKGGLGDDTYIVDLIQTGTSVSTYRVALQDTVTELSNAGTDTLILRGSFDHQVATTLILASALENLDASQTGSTKLNFTGNTLNNLLTGNAADNILNGGTGNDTLVGGDGNDTYFVDSLVEANLIQDTSGIDTLNIGFSYALTGTPLENLTLTGTTAINSTGNALNNVMIGNGGVNSIEGGSGNDTLNGGAGVDTLNGGDGDDTYYADSVVEANLIQDASGIDTLNIGFSYVLTGTPLENLTLTGTTAINGTGNASDNIITGNDGANILDGGLGADTLIGGKGNDTYLVDNIGDTVIEGLTIAQSGGTDTVKIAATYDGIIRVAESNIENIDAGLFANGIQLTGNSLANSLTGGSGNDSLDGGLGVDTLKGGLGDDTYIVDLIQTGTSVSTYRVALQDTVTELSNAGTDTLILRGSFDHQVATTLILASALENLDASQTGSTKLNFTGNTLNNLLTGNAADNILNGGTGNDTLVGGDGNDTLAGGAGGDVLVGGQGTDTLTGGDGNDGFYFDTFPQTGNEDWIVDFTSFTSSALNHDELFLFNNVFSCLSMGDLNVNNFLSANTANAVAQDADDYIIYDTDLGKLYYDADGSGADGQTLIATFANHAQLAASDIYVFQPT